MKTTRLCGLTMLSLTLTLDLASAQTPPDRRIIREPVAAERRLALVIGNDAYAGAPLRNAVSDARAIAAALRDVGFRVTLAENANRATLAAAVVKFEESLTPADVALFFFAGHGMQLAGENYLIPTDYTGDSTAAARFTALGTTQLQESLQKARVSLIVLDACRNNPYSSQRGSVGLAPIDARGSLVAFATGAGQTASDNAGSVNGLFTQELLNALRLPNLGIRDTFYQVRQRVFAASNGKQFPAVYDGLLGDVVLRPSGGAPTAVAPPMQQSSPAPAVDPVEVALWNAIDKSRSASDYDVYLKKYPNGIFADLARVRMAELGVKAGGVAAAPASTEPFLGVWKGTMVSPSKGDAEVTAEILPGKKLRWLNGPPSRVRGDIASGVELNGSWSVLGDQLTVRIDNLDYTNEGTQSCTFFGTIGQNQMQLTYAGYGYCSSFTLNLTRK